MYKRISYKFGLAPKDPAVDLILLTDFKRVDLGLSISQREVGFYY